MTREYDTQLLESVAVRRARMREALLWGHSRRERSTADNLKRFAVGLILAAVIGAGCVGVSFVRNLLAQQHQQQQQQQQRFSQPGVSKVIHP